VSDPQSGRDVQRTPPGSEWPGLPHLVLACSLALLAPLLGPLVTGRVFVYNDLIWFHLPLRHLFHEALRAGDTVLWTPSIFAGFYLHGEGQAGLFHPLHQLLYRGLPLGPAFNLELVASYPFAFAGMWWLLRRLAIGQAAALFGAMLFAFCGFNLLHHHHMNMVAAAAHLPWILAAADVVIGDERPRARRMAFAGLALAVGSALLLGFPQSVWWCFLALGPFAAFRAATARRWPRLLPCLVAVACGILLAGVQLLPSLDAAAGSTRAGLPADFALGFSLHPSNLIQLWSPYFFARGAHSTRDYMWFHEFGIYSGAILPVALAWTWNRWRAVPERRALLAAATGFAVVCLWLALGRYGGLAALLTHLPAIGSLRAPVRYIFLVQFALAIVAALAFDDLLDIVAGRRPAPTGRMLALWIPAALGVATTVALNSHLLPFGALTFAGVAAAAPGVAILVAVTGLVYVARRRSRWALPALVLVVAADLGAYGLGFVHRAPARTIAELTSAIPPAPDLAADAYAAAPTRGPYQADALVLRGYRLTSGYAGLFPQSRHPLDGRDTRILSGTRWIFDTDGRRQPFEGAVPRARLLDADRIPATGTVTVTVDRPGRLVARVDAPGPRLLAFTERFHAGWSVTSGAAAVTITPVEGDFLGAQLGPGTHEVDLTFMPRSFVNGSVVSAAGAVLLVAALVTWPRWQRASA
jgi:hypothetical protein